jgi:serine/threonine protein kinase/dipeptidyl aminopeptidase/acylaminoacyl peptidase
MQPGSSLGNYRIVRPLGAGGMGEVFEAEDTRLKRRVALKILPGETADDPARRARFQREAEAVAALNHPNIVTIYSVEEASGTAFLTMEVVGGTTLDAVIPPNGLPLPALLKYAIPIVDAIAAAHARGIVHRDLKPANVMVTSDGRVKVLDFGIAKLMDAATDPAAETATAGAPAGFTGSGQVLGTAAYMSPEQAQGLPADHRSDLFSLGVLLYEMATGVRPFRGETHVSVLASIVKDNPPPIRTIRRGIPPRLERLVADCLAKDPAARPQSAVDVRRRLEALAAPSSRLSPRRVAAAIAAAAVIAAGALYVVRRSSERANALPGTPIFTRLSFEPGVRDSPSLSPDGRDVVYASQPVAGHFELSLRRVDGSGPVVDLNRGSGAPVDAPAFSPDGRQIAFVSSRDNSPGLFVMDRDGGNIRRILNGAFDPSWTPDGREIVYSTESGQDPDGREAPSELWMVDVGTGQTRRLAGTDAIDPNVSPDGRFVAFWALPVNQSGNQFSGGNRDIWVQPLAGGARIRITDSESSDWSPAWSADGRYLYFSSDRSGTMNIWRMPIDTATGRAAGAPVAISAPASYVSEITVGKDGTVAYGAFDYDTAIRSIDFDSASGTVAGQPRTVVAGRRSWLHPDVSPDGRLLTMRSFRGQEDVWVVNVDGSGLRQVTNDPARDRGSRWAPDGSLLFYSTRGGGYEFWSIHADGTGARQLTHGDWALNYPLPSHDGRWVAGTDPNTNEQMIFDAHDWSKPPGRLPAPPGKGQTYLRDWSPDDGRIVAADTTNHMWIFDLESRTWAPAGTGALPRWLPDGRRLVAVSRGHVVLVDPVTKQSRDIYSEPGRYVSAVALTRDGRHLYFTSALTQSDIWTMRFRR